MNFVKLDEHPNGTCFNSCGNALNVEFHIRQASDINGAGWDAGKFSSGTTNVIE